ncbi:MAG: BrnT family toxin [Candidatus Omnitrophica bacterium]|nr:BrnT family toxin [Candidatus Omnitrophota bacterium]
MVDFHKELAAGSFIWDGEKEAANIRKHGVDFSVAAEAFKDPARIILHDEEHSSQEERLYCIGRVEGRILTVRFTIREGVIRIFGAGYWRKGEKRYEKKAGLR